MNIFLILAFLFFMGSLIGWVLEVFYRRFFSDANPERKWINPGFCVGPYIPLYGNGLCILYLIASLEKYPVLSDPLANRCLLFVGMAIGMTLIEYLAGLMLLKWMHLRLWDYSTDWGNIQGLICPKFSFYWAVLGAVYYFLIHPRILQSLEWLAANLAFSFFVGLFFGFFTIDVVYSSNLVWKLKTFAVEHNVILEVEHFKAYIRHLQEEQKRVRFLFSFEGGHSISVLLDHYHQTFHEKRTGLKESIKANIKEKVEELGSIRR